MMILLVFILEILGIVTAVLAALGVPLFFGLIAWDLIDQAQRARAAEAAEQPETVPAVFTPRAAPAIKTRRIPA
jgi:hypothetical protein